MLPNNPPTVFQSCSSTGSNFCQPPDVLDPSSHSVTQQINLTDYVLVPANTSPIDHYCNTLGIKLPSGRYGGTSSQGGSKKILHCPEQKESEAKSNILVSTSCIYPP